jgi:hypothetical protein
VGLGVPHPLRISKGAGLDSEMSGNIVVGGKNPHPCKTRKSAASQNSKTKSKIFIKKIE